jgi:hypothetical protein
MAIKNAMHPFTKELLLVKLEGQNLDMPIQN